MSNFQRRLVRVAAAAVAVVGWGPLIVAPTGASAAIVTHQFSGTVSGANTLGVSMGDTFTGTLVYDTSGPAVPDLVLPQTDYNFLGPLSPLKGPRMNGHADA